MSPRPGGFSRGAFRRMAAEPPKNIPSLKRLKRHFGRFLLQHKWAIALGTSCVTLGLLMSKLQPLIIRFLVDEALTPILKGPRTPELYLHSRWLVMITLGGMLVVSLLRSGISRLHMRTMRRAGAMLVRDLRLHVYNHIQKLSLRFYESQQTGDIMSRVTSDVAAMERLITGVSDRLLTDALNLVVTLMILLMLDWRLALVALIPVPFLLLIMRWFSKRVRPVYREVRDRFGSMNSRLQDNISGIRVIKAFNTEAHESGNFEEENNGFFDTQLKEIKLSSTAFPLIRFVDGLGAIMVTAAGSYMLLQPDPRITLGDLFAFNAFVMQLYHPIGTLFHVYNTVLRSLASGDRIADLLEEEPDVEDKKGAVDLPPVDGRVRFEGVSFHYIEGTPVLDEIDIEAKSGEIIALVGPSGTGKTSIVNMIPRFYDPVTGRILIDGHDLRDVTQASLRSQIAVVLQDPFLFNGTILDNIRYACPGADEAQVVKAAEAANAHEFILELSKGYETEIGERGVKLSGGQKQRVAIARALLADRRILILDEATSMIDSHAEYLIQKALAKLMKNRTTFVIAHRLSTVKHADKILVIKEGRIVEAGDHDALISRDDVYAEMYRAQFRLDQEVSVQAEEGA